MDNLTHSLVGLTAAKTGLERLSPGATLLCVLAANAPDSDVVVGVFGDRWDLLQHHRGITHSIVGTAVLALLLPLIFYAVDRLWARVRHRPPKTNLRGLLIVSFIVSATHPLLDWTNNYGIRLLLPWNPRWFYGDLVFIVDPFIWVILIAGLLLIWRVRAETKAKIAFASFAVVVAYWGMLAFAHAGAAATGGEEAQRIAASNGETISRLAAMPTLANPLRWDCVFETDKATYRFRVALNGQTPAGRVIRYPKPSGPLDAALREVAGEKPARVFLGFARFPVARLSDPSCTTQTLLQLADLRYTEPGASRGTFALELPVDCPNEELTGGR
ncbi:MAG TPA: metal-dependent hydrolase [Pyrinomonadaceae bacterium]